MHGNLFFSIAQGATPLHLATRARTPREKSPRISDVKKENNQSLEQQQQYSEQLLTRITVESVRYIYI